ncbi:hypothetical protein CHLNCDRAFT_55644 [Chlorella variabilis]|uniref:Uncharacterized protein n=1 Tax=Chlorella variabilis TaxID=554065 RepID=E1ZU18_CHLVA|nr:hypothetical protein CHLNCDRAFT_55644 [Chlorella variabilis]EFN50681.1 hypothetical protein CHLNCDRAFT_55644 [Chlorella variabilis]|eukprot:XP_005842793.1 hypothetical protein CHLNCDRAFT_55644 [Chlorella variabilis]
MKGALNVPSSHRDQSPTPERRGTLNSLQPLSRLCGPALNAVPDFKYLGITFHCCKPLGESAAAARAAVARFAAASFEARCEELGLEAAKLLLTLYDVLVDSTLSYAGAVWAPGLAMAAAARPVVSGGAGRSTPLSEPELQHLRFLRRLLALPRSTPAATILAEAGQPPLHARWLRQAARLWNSLVTAPEGSMPRLVVQAAAAVAVDCADVLPQRQPWAAQLAHSLRAVGLTFEPLHMDKISPDSAQQATLRLHLARVTQETPAHTRLRHYFCDVRPECCSLDGYGRPPYVTEVLRHFHKSAAARCKLYVELFTVVVNASQDSSEPLNRYFTLL